MRELDLVGMSKRRSTRKRANPGPEAAAGLAVFSYLEGLYNRIGGIRRSVTCRQYETMLEQEAETAIAV